MFSLFRIVKLILFVVFIIFSCKKSSEPLNGVDDENKSDISPSYYKVIAQEPSWSPCGRYIAYTHMPQDSVEFKNGTYQVWILNLDTNEKNFLTTGMLPDWSPDGKKIVFVKGVHLYVFELETEKISRLTRSGKNFFPSWSPDGKKIVYDSNDEDPRGASVIWIMDADGNNKKDISVHGTGEWRNPDWSPDGKYIVHSRYLPNSGPDPEIGIMDTTGNNWKRLTDDDCDDRYPCWSPDGKKIAWLSIAPGQDPKAGIWTMNSDGSNKLQLTDYAEFPSWSPDSKQIVYNDIVIDSLGITNYVLWLMDANGNNKRPLMQP